MRKFFKESGQLAVEYAFILVLVAIVIVAVLTLLGPQVASLYSCLNSAQ